MQLILSGAALPDGSLGDLRRAAQRRSLQGLELIQAGGPVRVACEAAPDDALACERQAETPPIRWLVLPEDVPVARLLYWGRWAHLTGAGLFIRQPVTESLAGVPLALVHGTDPAEAQRAAAWARLHDAHTCWQIEPAARVEDRWSSVLEITAPHLAHVRLLGAGPEAQDEAPDTVGTGALMGRLALQGYDGTMALAPSGPGLEDVWRTWLFDRRGWGCGTAARKKAARLVSTHLHSLPLT